MPWLSLGASLLMSAGVVCLSLACFHMFVLLPRWRRSMRALGYMADNDRRAFEDVVPGLKEAKVSAGSDRRRADRRKSFA